jgi:hypothetical protein
MPDNNNCNSNQIELSLELVRLSQVRAKDHGVRIENELARQVAEEAILMLPEEPQLLLDDSATMSQSNVLSGAVGVNDLVVNGRPIDVRPLIPSPALQSKTDSRADSKTDPQTDPQKNATQGQDRIVSIDRVLIGSPYLAHGSLVVCLDNSRSGVGAVVGYVTPSAWLKAEEGQKGQDQIHISVTTDDNFDLAQLLFEISQKPIIKLPSMSRISDVKQEVGELVNNRENQISARQKQIFAFLSTNWTEETLNLVESVPVKFSLAKMQRILGDGVRWQGKVDRLVEQLAIRFPELGKEELKSRVLLAGERWGSQLGAPRYRRALLAELVALSMLTKNAKSPMAASLGRAQALAEKVLSGISAIDAVKNVIGNQMAVDLAFAIQKHRKSLSLSALVAATAEELGMAYGQLALSPAYATHSNSEESGLESVNEALVLIEVSHLAEGAKAIEIDLAGF